MCTGAGAGRYKPKGKGPRGDAAAKPGLLPPERTPTFQPKLHLSKKAQKMKEHIKGRRLDGLKKTPDDRRDSYVAAPLLMPPCEVIKDDVVEPVVDRTGEAGFVLDCVAFSRGEANVVGKPLRQLGARAANGPRASSAPVRGKVEYNIHGNRVAAKEAVDDTY